jgi:hypothetical protein
MKRILCVLLGAAALTAGCADPVPPTAPSPAVPTVTETFNDTLLVGGTNFHNFTVTAVGGLKVTLPAVTPGAAVGVGVGTSGVTGCTLIDHLSAVAGSNVLLSGTVTVPGTYCVEIFDLIDPTSGVGNLVEPVVYTINVLHS